MSVAALRGHRRPVAFTENGLVTGLRGSARKLADDPFSQFLRDSVEGGEFIRRGLADPLQASEVRQQSPAPGRTDPVDIVEARAQAPFRAQLAVKCVRESMRLVAQLLELSLIHI